MKKIIISIVLVATLLFTVWGASDTRTALSSERTKDFRNNYLGSKTPYPIPDSVYSKVPDGYKLVFINYVGRHGSRYLSSAKYDKTLYELLSIAETDGQLTESGKELKKEIGRMMDIERGHYGLLTLDGKKQLEGIGERVVSLNPDLFRTRKRIIAWATYSPRAQDSRDHFVTGLLSKKPDLQVTSRIYEENKDPYLRPYDIAPEYQAFESGGAWKKIYKEYVNRTSGRKMDKDVLLNLFTEVFYKRLENGDFKLTDDKGKKKLKDPSDAALNLYNLYVISAGMTKEGSFDFKKYFTDKQLSWYEGVLSLEDYFQKGPSISFVPENIIAPLVKELINSTEENLHDSGVAGIFRFAHAETIIPLAAFLDIKNCNISSDDPETALENWNAAVVTPMAANIQWLIYSNGKNYLIKMLQNERETAFPVKTTIYPYYQWDDVQAYYTAKIKKAGFARTDSLDDDIELLKSQH